MTRKIFGNWFDIGECYCRRSKVKCHQSWRKEAQKRSTKDADREKSKKKNSLNRWKVKRIKSKQKANQLLSRVQTHTNEKMNKISLMQWPSKYLEEMSRLSLVQQINAHRFVSWQAVVWRNFVLSLTSFEGIWIHCMICIVRMIAQ